MTSDNVTVVLETDRLQLRWLTVADAPFTLELLNEPAYLRHIGDKGVRNLDDARAYLRDRPMASYRQHGFGLYAVERKDSGVAIGMCGLIKRETLADVDIGYAFLAAHRGQGYAIEAATAVMAYGRDAFGLTRIVAITSADNERSIGLLHKLGLTLEQTIVWPDGETVSLYGPGQTLSSS